jgi:hypothetical protein
MKNLSPAMETVVFGAAAKEPTNGATARSEQARR